MRDHFNRFVFTGLGERRQLLAVPPVEHPGETMLCLRYPKCAILELYLLREEELTMHNADNRPHLQGLKVIYRPKVLLAHGTFQLYRKTCGG